MLGSMSEAEDAVQESWLRLNRSDPEAIANLPGWLTAVVARVSLDMLRARRARREDYAGSWLPEPVVKLEDDRTRPRTRGTLRRLGGSGAPGRVGHAHACGAAGVRPARHVRRAIRRDRPDRRPNPGGDPSARQSGPATRSRGPRRWRTPTSGHQRELVDAFLAASRGGDFAALLAVLDPEVVFRADTGGVPPLARAPVVGAEAVARQVLSRGRPFAGFARPAIVNGAPGVVVAPGGKPMAVVGFTTAGGRIVAIDLIADPAKLRSLFGEDL